MMTQWVIDAGVLSCLSGPQLEEQLGLDSSIDFFGGDKGEDHGLAPVHKVDNLQVT